MSGDDHKPKRGADQKIHPTDTASLAQRHSTYHKKREKINLRNPANF